VVAHTHSEIRIDPKALKLKVQQIVNKKFETQNFDKEVSAARARGAQVTRAYYGAAIRGIGAILDNPRMSAITTGDNPPRVTEVPMEQAPAWLPGETPIVLPGQWKRLSKRYILQDPLSVTFWKKTGRLSSFYRQEIMADSRWKQLKNYYRGNRINLVPTRYRGAAARAGRFNLLLPGLPTPVNRIIRESFGRGRVLRDRPMFDRDRAGQSLWRIQWPEWTRPWLSRYASTLGKRYRKALRTHLR
jgi:hypothetical protein